MEAIGRIARGVANELTHLVSVIGKQTDVVLSGLKPDDPHLSRSTIYFKLVGKLQP